ncbi:Protein vip1 [Rhizina undulata]
MSKTTIHVSNIDHNTTEKEVQDFFSFCGKITSLTLTPTSNEPDAPLSATVNYERESAAKTALLLDGTKLGPNQVHVTSAHSLDEIASGHLATGDADYPADNGEGRHDGELRQEDKPRAAILAEYLSHGYVIADGALEKGIELDKAHGISSRFTGYLTSTLKTLDSKLHATDKAKSVDTQYHLTDKALSTKQTLQTYFEKALGTPVGQKIRHFYTTGEKQVLDIHNEARRLAELRKSERRRSTEMVDEDNNAGPTTVAGTDKTVCNCHGNEGECRCAPEKCVCSGCSKKMTKTGETGARAAGEVKDSSASAAAEETAA